MTDIPGDPIFQDPALPPEKESILLSIKKMLGLSNDYDAFDTDVIIHINSALMYLRQLGVGDDNVFEVTGVEEFWQDLLPTPDNLGAAKTYVYLRVRLAFDPPTNSFAVAAIERQIDELEWRLNVEAESKEFHDEFGY